MKSLIKLLVLFLLALGVVSCQPYIRPEQPYQTHTIPLESNQVIGQTFSARYDGLQGISLYFDPGNFNTGAINLHLRNNPLTDTDLRFSSIPAKTITKPGFYTFQFPPIENSSQATYYLFLKNKGPSTIYIGTADYFTYLDGTLYLDHLPQDLQASFHLVYDIKLLVWGLLGEGLTWLLWLAASFFLFVIPGWGLLLWLFPGWMSQPWETKLGLALGLSLAIYPVIFLWTNLFKLNLGALYAWIPPIVGAAIIIGHHRTQFRKFPATLAQFQISRQRIAIDFWPNFSLVLLFCLIFAIRLWVVRTLEIPLWGDSYQHTMITQLIVDNGGLFTSWQPYADLQTFTYHFGFHALAAIFHWFTGLSMPQSVLIMGQLLNGFAVIALIPLARKISSNRWTGVFTILLAGLLLQMPMFYVNWGRYTQLAAQVILPTALFLIWESLEDINDSRKWLILSIIAWAGLALTHYRLLIFAALFLPALFLFEIHQGRWKKKVTNIFWLGLGSGLIFMPWFVRVFGGKIIDIFNYHTSSPANQLPAATQAYNAIGNLTDYIPLHIWLLLPIVLAWGFWRREKNFAILSLWSFFVFLAANPHWFNLPGAGTLTNFAVFIAAYIPASLLLAAGSAWMVEVMQVGVRKYISRFEQNFSFQPLISTVLWIVIVGLGFFGIQHRIHDIEINNRLFVTDPDQRAMEWIRKNISEDSHFLVNSFPAYGNSLIAGADAGWWIPLLANRQTSLPPLVYGSEQGPRPDFQPWIKLPTFKILEKGITHPEVLDLLQERDLEHIFIGQQRGRINNPQPFLDPHILLEDPHFKLIYRQDGVWIFMIIYD